MKEKSLNFAPLFFKIVWATGHQQLTPVISGGRDQEDRGSKPAGK
jgi:hypothetical protein